MQDFLKKMSEILEVEPSELTGETDYRTDVPYWDSMMGFMTLCMIDEDYGKKVTVDEFLATKTLGDLWKIVSE